MTFKEKTQKHINNEERFAKLCKYVDMIEETNKVMNLTGFTGDKLWEEGIYESITALEAGIKVTEGKLMLDIGAGAGFPSIPYLIAHPDLKVVIYEPSKKRTEFLAKVSNELNLGVEIQRIRVEESKERERFDIVTARAVVRFEYLLEACHHVAKTNGEFVFVKGPKAVVEIQEAGQVAKKFGVHAEAIDISTEEKSNNLIYYRKEVETPAKFPRTWAMITKKR